MEKGFLEEMSTSSPGTGLPAEQSRGGGVVTEEEPVSSGRVQNWDQGCAAIEISGCLMCKSTGVSVSHTANVSQ